MRRERSGAAAAWAKTRSPWRLEPPTAGVIAGPSDSLSREDQIVCGAASRSSSQRACRTPSARASTSSDRRTSRFGFSSSTSVRRATPEEYAALPESPTRFQPPAGGRHRDRPGSPGCHRPGYPHADCLVWRSGPTTTWPRRRLARVGTSLPPVSPTAQRGPAGFTQGRRSSAAAERRSVPGADEAALSSRLPLALGLRDACEISFVIPFCPRASSPETSRRWSAFASVTSIRPPTSRQLTRPSAFPCSHDEDSPRTNHPLPRRPQARAPDVVLASGMSETANPVSPTTSDELPNVTRSGRHTVGVPRRESSPGPLGSRPVLIGRNLPDVDQPDSSTGWPCYLRFSRRRSGGATSTSSGRSRPDFPGPVAALVARGPLRHDPSCRF